MTIYPGRGAFTSVGKDNGSSSYVYLTGKPDDGSTPTKGINYQAVSLGVLAIQKRINVVGYSPALVEDGDLGPASDRAIRWFQGKNNLMVDGDCGPNTARVLWHPIIGSLESSQRILGHHLWGIASHESLLDPGAVGSSTPGDRGLVQWNTSNAGLTIQQAHDPVYALTKAAQRIYSAQIRYGTKGDLLRTNCSIAQWNSPLWADQWYSAGKPPNDQIASYVSKVLTQALSF